MTEKVFDNDFHMRQHIYWKTFPSLNLCDPPKMPEQQVGSDAGTEERAEDNTEEGKRDESSGLVVRDSVWSKHTKFLQ